MPYMDMLRSELIYRRVLEYWRRQPQIDNNALLRTVLQARLEKLSRSEESLDVQAGSALLLAARGTDDVVAEAEAQLSQIAKERVVFRTQRANAERELARMTARRDRQLEVEMLTSLAADAANWQALVFRPYEGLCPELDGTFEGAEERWSEFARRWTTALGPPILARQQRSKVVLSWPAVDEAHGPSLATEETSASHRTHVR
jgi:hypothetical protein